MIKLGIYIIQFINFSHFSHPYGLASLRFTFPFPPFPTFPPSGEGVSLCKISDLYFYIFKILVILAHLKF